MSTDDLSDDARDRPPPFVCDWNRQGLDAASVQVSGPLNAATSRALGQVLGAALADARLVLLHMRDVSFVDEAGVQMLVDASVRARAGGRRLLLVGAREQPAFTSTGGEVEWLQTELPLVADNGLTAPDPIALADLERGLRPLDNPVNRRVLAARVMAVPDAGLWLHDSDGRLHRAWAPQADPVAHGTPLEIYLDRYGALNGWRDPSSGLAINQRRFDGAEPPATGTDLRCHGACGVVWLAPAAEQLIEYDERCLTCAGALALD